MESKASHLRVLIFAQNRVQPFTGGGILLGTLFRHVASDHLLFFHRDQEYGQASRYEEHRLVGAWLRVEFGTLARQLGAWLRATIRRPVGSNLRDLSSLVAGSSRFELPRELVERVRTFAPDIIYAWAADSLWAGTVTALSRKFGVPYVIHFMDNHFEMPPRNNLEQALLPEFRQRLNELMAGAAAMYVISDQMGAAYAKHWPCPYEVFRGTADVAAWPWPNMRNGANDGVFRIGFAGTLDRSQLEGLRMVAQALHRMRHRGRQVRLTLFLTESNRRFAEPILSTLGSVEFRPHPHAADLRHEFGDVDVLLMSYAFDAATVQYYRYSFATKSAVYMLSGRPILVLGPAAIEPVNYCIRGGWAAVVTEPDEDALIRAIERLMDDPIYREQLGRAAWEAGCLEHDQDKNAGRFAASLARLSGVAA
ncbi:MAG TPA: hypothetical protein VK629_16660 [Steroidobacteraceae bacterium]|nr:hypothetical protein [Steroidobacteraceae bacterium]